MSRGTDVMMSDRSLLAAVLLAEDCIIRGNQSSRAKRGAPLSCPDSWIYLFCGLRSLMSSLGSPVVALKSTCSAE
jgi:hypothetical protein